MLVGRRGVCAVKRLPGQLEPSSTGNRGRWMHRQRKHRTYGVSAVCRKSAGIEKYTGSDSARSIRIPNVEEAALTEQLGETEPEKSALSFTAPAVKPWMKHRCENTKITVTGMAATKEAAIM